MALCHIAVGWRTSSYSPTDNCVEVGRVVHGWRKSSRSSEDDNCVEIGHVADGAAVRDTKDRAAGYFTTTGGQWAAFIAAIKHGRYDA